MSAEQTEGLEQAGDNWRLVITEPATGAWNMAMDEAIMTSINQGQTPPTIRFYQWSTPTISLGYFQSLAKELDLQACQRTGVDVVRRLTGGRAVLHNQEFTYSLIAPENQQEVAGYVLQSYLRISKGLLLGLANLGVEAEITPGTELIAPGGALITPGDAPTAASRPKEAVSSAACFDAPSRYELVVGGKKLVGSAQTRRKGCLLQHGSIPLQLDADLLFSVLNYASEELRARAKAYLLSKATDLEQVLAYQPEFSQLCTGFQQGLAAGLGINLVRQKLLPEELKLAEHLAVNKYNTLLWNGRK